MGRAKLFASSADGTVNPIILNLNLRWEFFRCDKLYTTVCTLPQLLENDHLIKFEVFINGAFKYLIDNT